LLMVARTSILLVVQRYRAEPRSGV
jgi:hypothetical protein